MLLCSYTSLADFLIQKVARESKIYSEISIIESEAFDQMFYLELILTIVVVFVVIYDALL